MPESRILVIDSDDGRRERLAAVLEFVDFTPVTVADVAELDLKKGRQRDWAAIVLGQVASDTAWGQFQKWLVSDPLHPPLMLLPEHHYAGARKFSVAEDNCHLIEYPVQEAQLSEILHQISGRQLTEDADRRIQTSHGPSGKSPAVSKLRHMIGQVAEFNTTVLILGESGTGKEVVARAIHEQGARAKQPFVAINCGAIPPDLLESEMFGHEKGAFTGAITARAGRFEMAQGGTLFLDEIGDMSLPMQVKLLRVLQEKCFERVGSNQTQSCDVRIIAATHRNLEQRIQDGAFREDLFYRLNVFPIEMPALRERIEDLPQLIEQLSAGLHLEGRGQVKFSAKAIAALGAYAWPGNVRELANLVERVSVLQPGGVIDVADLPERYRPAALLGKAQQAHAPAAAQDAAPATADLLADGGIDLRRHVAQVESHLIQQALQQTNGVVAHAAQLLGLRRTTLVEKLRKYDMDASHWSGTHAA